VEIAFSRLKDPKKHKPPPHPKALSETWRGFEVEE
jgi:hypothetical protein